MATLMKLVGNGRVLGISGTFGGVIQFSPDMWRYMFMVGMAAGTLAAVQTFGTAAFDVFPITYTIGVSRGDGFRSL